MMKLGLLLAIFFDTACDARSSLLTPLAESRDRLWESVPMIGSVLETWLQGSCFPMLLTDNLVANSTMIKSIGDVGATQGVGIFEVGVYGQNTNVTQVQLSPVVSQARQLRQVSWCTMVVVVSDDPAFLTAFGDWSLNGRLLVWSTRLLVVTRLPRKDLGALLVSHWTFSMMNTLVVNDETSASDKRYSMLVHLPYSPDGARVLQVASWTPTSGLRYLTPPTLFPEKYTNFFGATINVTALTFEPYWQESIEGNTTRYSGTDYNQLVTVAQALNFTFRVLPSRSWNEVTDQVQIRKSFMATVVYGVIPQELERWDLTFAYDQTAGNFAMATPVITPSWLNFYYPFSGQVWIGVLACTLTVCFTLVKITRRKTWQTRHGVLSTGSVVMESVGTLLGQGLFGRLSTSQSNHILVGTWLFFGVVVGTAYRASLIASLTLPRLPPRPETVEELVKVVERVTIRSFDGSYKKFSLNSESSAFRELGSMMVGEDVMDGLNAALTMKSAHLGARLNLQLIISRNFAKFDGTSPLYLGKEKLVKLSIAWPVPHDAPYTPQIDKCLRIISQAGLYEQWKKETMEAAARESRMKQREEIKQQGQDGAEHSQTNFKSLSIIHVQGPLLLLLVGITLGSVAFVVERLLVSEPHPSHTPGPTRLTLD